MWLTLVGLLGCVAVLHVASASPGSQPVCQAAGESCQIRPDYIMSYVRQTEHPALYKELMASELECGNLAYGACADLGGERCAWQDGKGCTTWNAASGFSLQVANCIDTDRDSSIGIMSEIELEATVEAECRVYQSKQTCEEALNGACSWAAELEFSSSGAACVAAALPFDAVKETLKLSLCDQTSLSKVALAQYESQFRPCGETQVREECLRKASLGCAWRSGSCRASMAVLLEPFEFVGARLAAEMTQCEAVEPQPDGSCNPVALGGSANPPILTVTVDLSESSGARAHSGSTLLTRLTSGLVVVYCLLAALGR